MQNLKESETIGYSLALVRGRAPIGCSYIRVRGNRKSQTSEWPVIGGDFRLLVELQRGVNKFELEAGGFKKKFSLTYEPRATRLRVTPVYVICAGHDGYFQVCANFYQLLFFIYFLFYQKHESFRVYFSNIKLARIKGIIDETIWPVSVTEFIFYFARFVFFGVKISLR